MLLQAANHPHADLAPHEVEAACHMSEHLVYLVQQGRSTLGALSSCYQQLGRLLSLLGTLAPAASAAESDGKVAIPAQVQCQLEGPYSMHVWSVHPFLAWGSCHLFGAPGMEQLATVCDRSGQ